MNRWRRSTVLSIRAVFQGINVAPVMMYIKLSACALRALSSPLSRRWCRAFELYFVVGGPPVVAFLHYLYLPLAVAGSFTVLARQQQPWPSILGVTATAAAPFAVLRGATPRSVSVRGPNDGGSGARLATCAYDVLPAGIGVPFLWRLLCFPRRPDVAKRQRPCASLQRAGQLYRSRNYPPCC